MRINTRRHFRQRVDWDFCNVLTVIDDLWDELLKGKLHERELAHYFVCELRHLRNRDARQHRKITEREILRFLDAAERFARAINCKHEAHEIADIYEACLRGFAQLERRATRLGLEERSERRGRESRKRRKRGRTEAEIDASNAALREKLRKLGES